MCSKRTDILAYSRIVLVSFISFVEGGIVSCAVATPENNVPNTKAKKVFVVLMINQLFIIHTSFILYYI